MQHGRAWPVFAKVVKWASDSKSHYVQHLHKYTGNPDKYINKYECCIWQSHGV